jgi:REP element-mobilizing transposase RayT
MELLGDQLYHIYNQGNNHSQLFYSRENYLHFLKLVRKFIFPNSQIVAYCLMPNHYHFLISTGESSIIKQEIGNIEIASLKNGFRLLQSSYTLGFNKSNNRSGSLFRQKARFKLLENSNDLNYPFVCFQYIHQNPVKSKLCKKMEDWEFSSFKDYMGIRNGTLIDKDAAFEYLDINTKDFYKESYSVISPDLISELY